MQADVGGGRVKRSAIARGPRLSGMGDADKGGREDPCNRAGQFGVDCLQRHRVLITQPGRLGQQLGAQAVGHLVGPQHVVGAQDQVDPPRQAGITLRSEWESGSEYRCSVTSSPAAIDSTHGANAGSNSGWWLRIGSPSASKGVAVAAPPHRAYDQVVELTRLGAGC